MLEQNLLFSHNEKSHTCYTIAYTHEHIAKIGSCAMSA